jgi:predicted transcriptional regulator YdeE
MLECKKVKKKFKVVGIKGRGDFANFGTDVPKLAQQLLIRSSEIQNCSHTEIALFEPKRDAYHLEGQYYVGLIVNDTLNEVPSGMDYIETNQVYVTTRGKITNLGNLHSQLLKWVEEQGFKRDLESHIVETYHSMEGNEEEVEIYLPIHS